MAGPPQDTLPEVLSAEAPAGFELIDYSPLPVSREVLALGRALFFDPILSVDRSVSCASCHQPDYGFADRLAHSVGVGGQRTPRNAPTLFNRALGSAFMWDGRAETLEDQVLQPIQNPMEMGLGLDDAISRLSGSAVYRGLFMAAFNSPPSQDRLARALAAFVRRLWIGNSPVDRFRAGERGALSDSELAGLWLYESRGGCWRCHSGPNFTDEGFHNTGVGAVDGHPEPGRFLVSQAEGDRGSFKTPTLRGLAMTAPYMHDGSISDLRGVVEFYREGGRANGSVSPMLTPLELSERDVDSLVAFLEALSR